MSTVRRVAVAAAALAIGASLASCQYLASTFPDVPTPAPTTTGAPAETDMQRQMRLDYEAAEKAYRTSAVEAEKIVNGGATKPSADFKAVATGEYVDRIMGLAGQVRQAGYSKVTGGTVIRGVVPAGYQEKKIKLIACEDVSQLKAYKDGKRVKGTNSTPYYVQDLTVIKTKASTWKVSDIETTQVKSLEGQPCVNS